MANVPEQVRRQAERAEAFFNQAENPTESQEEQRLDAPQEPEPEVEKPEPTANEQPPAQPESTAQEPPAPEPAQPKEKPEDYEHKYRTLQGVFEAERRARQAEKEQFEARIKALEQAQAKPPTQPEPQPTKQKLVTDKDIETYGPELVDLIGRKATEMADEIVAKRMAELKPELDKTKEQVASVAGRYYQNEQERFYGELAKAVPDWQQVNTDERWLSWLGETDPVFGVPRQVALDNASSKLDYTRVAKLFDAFKKEAGLTATPEPEPAPAPAPAKPALSPTPRTVGNATAPTPREPDTSVSRSQIAAHYRRAASDVNYRTSKEHEAMEGRIATAMATGKIVEA